MYMLEILFLLHIKVLVKVLNLFAQLITADAIFKFFAKVSFNVKKGKTKTIFPNMCLTNCMQKLGGLKR